MYYPYFRGKQYELMVIRENASVLKESNFIPIIEPVKETLNGLERAINEVRKVEGTCIVIVNPQHGDHKTTDGAAIRTFIEEKYAAFDGLIVGILLSSSMTLPKLNKLCNEYKKKKIALIHYGFSNGRELSEIVSTFSNITHHIFIEQFCSKLYRKHFSKPGVIRVLIRDGFQKRNNKDHPDQEAFSDLHITFRDEGMQGFGDFLIVGDDYSEIGGPAWAVAIHLTYINRASDDEMYISHFVSDRTSTPTDPAGKFSEALVKLVKEVRKPTTSILKTTAVKEYLELNQQDHFPGLGYAKKLSMQHHIETLAAYFKKHLGV
jgi:hypothetical protein